MEQVGFYQGKHYSAHWETIQRLKKEQNYAELEQLLTSLLPVIERESQVQQAIVAPAYYEELAILYRKQKRDQDELAVLERFNNLPPDRRNAPKLQERLAKVKERLSQVK